MWRPPVAGNEPPCAGSERTRTLILSQQTANIPNEQEMNSLKSLERNEACGYFNFSPASLLAY